MVVVKFEVTTKAYIDTQPSISKCGMSEKLPKPISNMPYPNAYQIEEMFANRSNPSIFNTYFTDSVDVIVVGQDFHLGGRYTSIEDFHNGLFERTVSRFKDRTYTLEIVRVIGGGESAWAAVETMVNAITENGKPWKNEWVDLVRFNSQGKITQMKEFFDTGHVHNHLEELESESKKAK
ncbi:hypothetical protein BDR22DRAFT_845345 [Usnea florida]